MIQGLQLRILLVNGKSTGLSRGMEFKERIKNTSDWIKDRSVYKPEDPI